MNTLCGMCMMPMFKIDITPIYPCCHVFHPSCIKQYLQQHGPGPVRCPMSVCREIIDPKCLRELSVKSPVELSCCPNAHCKHQFSRSSCNFKCPECGSHYCLNCRTTFHTGYSCEEFRRMHPESIDGNYTFKIGLKLKECPKCGYWLEKILGQNDLLCRCGYSFCFVCGKEFPNCKCFESKKSPRALPQYITQKRCSL